MKLLINNNYTGGSTVIEHNRMDRVWAPGPDLWVKCQRCGQKGNREGKESQHVHFSSQSGQSMTLFIILFVLSEYSQKHTLKGQRCDREGI